MLSVGSLFSGIGGFDLGLERAGMRTVWFCERDEFCQHVLAQHWPGVPCYPDVTELRGADVEPVDVLCGGFPCQDISSAGNKAGIAGARSGLWSEYARLIGDLRPRYVVVENVSDLLVRGMGTVLGDLAALGYDAEWDCIPASAVGAPHQRDRVWLVAYPDADGGRLEVGGEPHGRSVRPGQPAPQRPDSDRLRVADAEGERRQPRSGAGVAIRTGGAPLEPQGRPSLLAAAGGRADHWAVEPDVGRVAYGVPARVDRLRGLGNALVPQIAEWIGRRIWLHEQERGRMTRVAAFQQVQPSKGET